MEGIEPYLFELLASGSEDESLSIIEDIKYWILTGISEESFKQLLWDISEWYDHLPNGINMLQVLYRDHVMNTNALCSASKMIDLLTMLCGSGDLSPTDLSILYDTINVTRQFGFKPKFQDQFPSFQNVKEIAVSKFTWHRQKLLKLGMALTSGDVAKIDGAYNMPLLVYEDSWSLIMDLEHRKIIHEEEETMKELTDNLSELKLHSAVRALTVTEGSKKRKLKKGVETMLLFPPVTRKPKVSEPKHPKASISKGSKKRKLEKGDETMLLVPPVTRKPKVIKERKLKKGVEPVTRKAKGSKKIKLEKGDETMLLVPPVTRKPKGSKKIKLEKGGEKSFLVPPVTRKHKVIKERKLKKGDETMLLVEPVTRKPKGLYDFYIISDDHEWKMRIMKTLQDKGYSGYHREKYPLGGLKTRSRLYGVKNCTVKIIGFPSPKKKKTDTDNYIASLAVELMKEKDRLICVRISKDSIITEDYLPFTAYEGWDEDNLCNLIAESIESVKSEGSVRRSNMAEYTDTLSATTEGEDIPSGSAGPSSLTSTVIPKSSLSSDTSVMIVEEQQVQNPPVQVTSQPSTVPIYMQDLIVAQVMGCNGGDLELKDAGIKLHIPPGAIEEGVHVYISLENVLKDANMPVCRDLESRIAPIVACGPPGTVFNTHCSLSFPHNAVDEESWEFTVLVRESSLDTWKRIDSGDKDTTLSVQNGRCFIQTNHFSGETVLARIGRLARQFKSLWTFSKKLEVGLFGKMLKERYQLRVRTWNPHDKKLVLEEERDNETRLDLNLVNMKYEDIKFSIEEVQDGWQVEGNETVTLVAQKIWKLRPSGVFYFKRNDASEHDLGVKISAFQGAECVYEASLREISTEPALKMETYKMTSVPRGICLIFNNMKFTGNDKLEEREGSQFDATNLKSFFAFLGFNVQVEPNATAEKMERLIKDASQEIHAEYDCFVCCILSHGDEGNVFSSDGKRCKITKFTDAFLKCRTLAGKPKLFFLQACQGPRMSKPHDIQMDNPTKEGVPDYSDFLFAYSTSPGATSFRSKTSGSFYIKTLIDTLWKYHNSTEIPTILTHVNSVVKSKICIVRDVNHIPDEYQQVPTYRVTLEKKLFLTK